METSALGLAFFAAGIGGAFAAIAAAIGIGKLASAAMDGIARQPEAAGDIRGAMILTAAMIESAAFAAIAICFVLAFKV